MALLPLHLVVRPLDLDRQNRRFCDIKSTEVHACRYLRSHNQQFLGPAKPEISNHSECPSVARLPVCLLPLSLLPPPRRIPSIIHNHAQQPTTRRTEVIKFEGHLRPHRERKHHPFLRSRGVRRGRRGKSRLAEVEVGRVEVTKFKRHTNSPRWVCVVVTSVCRGFA